METEDEDTWIQIGELTDLVVARAGGRIASVLRLGIRPLRTTRHEARYREIASNHDQVAARHGAQYESAD
jgi:hypothetical protein